MNRKYKRLQLEERIVIQILLAEKRSIAYIAERLGRNRSSIHNEVKKWVVNPKDTYDAQLAQFCAKDDYKNKRNPDKINSHQKLTFCCVKVLNPSRRKLLSLGFKI